jgi:hypothetical protein
MTSEGPGINPSAKPSGIDRRLVAASRQPSRAHSLLRSVCLASLCDVAGGKRRGARSESPRHIIDDRSNFRV